MPAAALVPDPELVLSETVTQAPERTSEAASALFPHDELMRTVPETPAPVEQEPAAAPAYAAPPAYTEERVIEAPRPMGGIPSAPVALEPIVLPEGLEQVETDPEKVRIAASRVEPPQPPRPPRVRAPLPPISNEPLIQVETRK